MVVEQELQKLFTNLVQHHSAQIVVGGSEIMVSTNDLGNSLIISTPVYYGGNYIPTSVRNSIKGIPPFRSPLIQTNLIANEEKFEITLRFVTETLNMDTEKLKILLEEFAWLADEWRLLLDEQDRNDRVHIYVK